MAMLDDLFAEARQSVGEGLPDGLEQAILQDAAEIHGEVQAEVQANAQTIGQADLQVDLRVQRPAAETSGRASDRTSALAGMALWRRGAEKLRDIRTALGGWPAMAGLAAASLTGIWIGVAPPSFLPDPVALASDTLNGSSLPDGSYDLAFVLSEEAE